MASPFVAIEDLAKHLAVSVSTVRGWIRQGHIPDNTFLKINNVYRFDKDAVSNALLSKTGPIRSVVDGDFTDAHPVRYTSHDNTQYEMDLGLDEDI
jgi:excisionase family DNA binding protein